jgi:lysophospholipase L1-like esterase
MRSIPSLKQIVFALFPLFLLTGLLELGSARLIRFCSDGPHTPDWRRFWKLVPGYVGQFNGQTVRVNEMGSRGLAVPYAKPAGEFRILSIGESTTFGAYLPDEANYSALLQDYLNNRALVHNVVVINGGVSGYTSLQMLEYLRAEGQKYQPDLVLVYSLYNDAISTNQRSFLRMKELTRSDNEILAERLRLLRAAPFLGRSHLFNLLEYLNYLFTSRLGRWINGVAWQQKIQGPLYFRIHPAERRENLTQLVNLALDKQIRPVLCVPPLQEGRLLHLVSPIWELKKKKNIDVIDLRPDIDQHRELFLDVVHPTMIGHRLIAQKIANYLLDNRIVQ